MIILFREGTPVPAPNAILPDKLIRLIGTAHRPVILDVTSDKGVAANPRLLPGAIRADDRALADLPSLQAGRSTSFARPIIAAARVLLRGFGPTGDLPNISKAILRGGARQGCR